MPTTLIDPDGVARDVPDEVSAATLLRQGWRPQTAEDLQVASSLAANEADYGGVHGAIGAAGAGLARGITLGVSDIAARWIGGSQASQVLRGLRNENPIVSAGSEFAGALAPAILTGGASAGEEAAGLGARILAHTPAGLVGRAGSAISGLGEGAGLAGRVLAGTAGAAAEGSLYGGGQYLTESALQDKPLSAESFVAGMGHGALFAAPIGGGGVLASATLQKVRSLFPRSEVSAAAAAGVKGAASSGIAQALKDGDQMATAAERKLSDVDAGIGVAQAGETSTRRAFGAADPQALGDQVTGAVGRQQLTDALGAYRQARSSFEAWIADGGDPELERALTGLEPSDVLGRRVPVGEFGPPGGRGVKTPEELERLAAGSAGDGLAPALEPQAATAVGKRLGAGTPVEPVPAREILDHAREAAGPAPIAAGVRGFEATPAKASKARVAGRYRPAAETPLEVEPIDTMLQRALLEHGGGGGDLSGALSGTRSALGAGSDLMAIGAPARSRYVAAKDARTSAAADHFRAQALASRAERAGLGNPDAPWNEGVPGRGGSYTGSGMGADERALQAQAREAGSAAAWDAARAGEVPSAPTGLTGMHEALGLNPPRGEAAVSERGTVVDSLMRERMAGVTDEAAIAKAIMRHNGKARDVGPDIGRGANVIDALENANAKLTDVLGGEAPGTAVQGALAYRAALQDAQGRTAASSAKAAADLTSKAPAADATVVDDEITTALRKHDAKSVPAIQATTSSGGHLADVGSALEILRAVGAHVPAVSAIPVIGPILGLWLKARAVMGILGRKGGAVGKSTEGLIAGTAAAARDRLVSATSALLEGGAKVASKVPRVAGPAVLLAESLFPGGDKPHDDSPRALFEARSADITRAMTPGAVDQAIGQRYPTSDPALHDAIVAQVQRGIAFLDAKRPKETTLPGMLPGDGVWHPSLAAINEFGKYVHAVNDPISVIDDLGRGVFSAEGAETLRVVYPELFAYAQRALMKAAPEMAKTLPYPRRIALSIMYQLPVDATMQAGHARYLAAPTPAAGPPAAPSGPSGPLKLGKLTMSPLDQRAAGA